jgi:hypothetical protein
MKIEIPPNPDRGRILCPRMTGLQRLSRIVSIAETPKIPQARYCRSNTRDDESSVAHTTTKIFGCGVL